MRVNHQHIQLEPFDQILEAVIEQANIVALAQDAGNFARLDAGWNQKDLALNGCAQQISYIVGAFFDIAFAPQVIVQGVAHHLVIHAENDMDTWRSNISVHHADAETLGGKQIGQVCAGVRFACPAAE